MEKIFHLKENKTDVKTEVIAVNYHFYDNGSHSWQLIPGVLERLCGMDKGAVFTATALGGSYRDALNGGIFQLSLVLAPGMGLNARLFLYVRCFADGV